MSWTTPQFTKNQVNRAGKTLVDPNADPLEIAEALDTLNNWRASHSFPLNTLQVYLRSKSRSINPVALVAQRLKRVPSILGKLRRFDKMQLSRMQDLGGCRAVMGDINEVYELRAEYQKSNIKHTLSNEKDYIKNPKPSGYRGIHLVYKYYSDRTDIYNGLMIEIQMRSKIQHAWATAVETIGTFLQQALKSSEGPEEWLHFFTLAGSAFAEIEGTPQIQGTPTGQSLISEMRSLDRKLKVRDKLGAYGSALQIIENEGRYDHYFVLELRPTTGTVTVTGYLKSQLKMATDQYLDAEKRLSSESASDVVLVSVDSTDSLRKAYPNYFLDTRAFIEQLDTIFGNPAA